MIQSRKKKGIFILFLSLIPLCITGSVVLFRQSFAGKYLELVSLIFCLFFIGFLIVVFYALLSFNKITIENKTLTVSSLFGRKKKEIYLPLIHYWIERTKKDKYSTWYELTVFNDTGKHMISSYLYSNYDEMKSALVNYGYRNVEKEQLIERKKGKRASIILFSIGVALLSLCMFFYFKKPKPDIVSAQLKMISGLLDNEPKVIKGSKGERSLELELKNYPEFEFKISGSTFSATYAEDFVNNVKIGDSIFLNIDSAEYGKKISNTIPLGFFDKTVGYKHIGVIEFASGPYTYLSLEDYNIAHKGNNTQLILFLLIMGLFFTGLGVFSFKAKDKIKS